MEVTVIYKNKSLENVIFGELSQTDIEEIESLNNNKFISDRFTYKKVYTKKSLHEIADFLGIESYDDSHDYNY